MAQQVATRDFIGTGLICLWSYVEAFLSCEIRRHQQRQQSLMNLRQRCLHIYQ